LFAALGAATVISDASFHPILTMAGHARRPADKPEANKPK
jgi:hypothetical protein